MKLSDGREVTLEQFANSFRASGVAAPPNGNECTKAFNEIGERTLTPLSMIEAIKNSGYPLLFGGQCEKALTYLEESVPFPQT